MNKYKTKVSRNTLLTYFKYLLSFNTTEDDSILELINNNTFRNVSDFYLVTLYDIKDLDNFEYKGKLNFTNEVMETFLKQQNNEEIKTYIEDLLLDKYEVYDKQVSKFINTLDNLTPKNEQNLIYHIHLNKDFFISMINFMETHHLGYHSFYYFDNTQDILNLSFKLDSFNKFDTIAKDFFDNINIIVDTNTFKSFLHTPYEVIDRIKDIEEMDLKVYNTIEKNKYIYEIEVKFKLCKSNIKCLIS